MFQKLKEELKDKEKRNHYIKYLIVGLITTAISIGGFKLFRMYVPQLNENFANIFSIIIAIFFSYFLNRSLVFESKEKNILKEFGQFFSSRIATLIIEEIVFLLGILIAEHHEMIVKATASFVALIMNYIFSRWMVFKNSKINTK